MGGRTCSDRYGSGRGSDAERRQRTREPAAAAEPCPSGWRRKMKGGGHVSLRERGGLGRAGREAKGQEEWGRGGLLGRWRGKRTGERRGKGDQRGWLGQRPSGLVRLAGPKARNE
jgi:hypothetical protein